jgi:hypothetical protein
MKMITETDARLSSHELLCAERYAGINARLKRLEKILLSSAGAIILILLGLVVKL